jgi:hypothetical protein
MERDFGGVIWTNHALKRLKERNISQGDAWATFRRPEQSKYAKAKGAWVYYKTYGNQKIEVVAKKNEKKEWIILSVWSKTVYQKPQAKKSDSLLKLLVKRIFKK